MSQALEYAARPTAESTILSKLGPRIDSLDLLRGLAILGIFLMNTWTMSMPQEGYTNPAWYSPDWNFLQGAFPNGTSLEPLTGLNFWTYVIIHEFADMKFITMFSIMFGAGILLQGERAGIRGRNPWAVHYARMGVLLCFGLLHAFFMWYGDILTAYALCGILLFPIRRFYPAILTGIGMVMIAMVSVISMCYCLGANVPVYETLGWGTHKQVYDINPLDFFEREDNYYFRGGNDREITAYRGTYDPEANTFKGSYKNEMVHRVNENIRTLLSGFPTWEFLRCGGCMLLGMALLKRKFFHGGWSKEAYATIAGIATPVGWAVSGLGVLFNQQNGWNDEYHQFLSLWGLGVEFNYWGSLLCTVGYMCFGVLLAMWAADPARRILRVCLVPIRSVGRTALSNYIGQTFVGTTLFYGHGFGLFGYLSRAELVPIVLAMWVLQLTVSTVWLRYFRQGPLEWLWHSIVYWKWRSPLLPREVAGMVPQTAETIPQ